MEFNYYEILGVSRNASEDEIKSAFKTLAKKYHPDKHAGNLVYEEHFKKINLAYQTLSDTQKRRRYDVKLSYKAPPNKRTTFHPPQKPVFRKASPPPLRTRAQTLKYTAFTITGFLIFIIGTVFFYHFMNDITAKDHLEKGIQLEALQKDVLAIEQYSAAISYNEKISEAFVRRGNLRIKLIRDYEGALKDYSNALKIEKQSSVFFKRAQCYLKLKKYDEGLSDLNDAIDLDPQYDSLYFYKGEVYNYILKKYNKAIQEYEKAIMLNKNFHEAILGNALSKQSLMYYEASIVDFNTLIEMFPQEGSYYYYRGFSKFYLNDPLACSDWLQSDKLHFTEARNPFHKYCK